MTFGTSPTVVSICDGFLSLFFCIRNRRVLFLHQLESEVLGTGVQVYKLYIHTIYIVTFTTTAALLM